MHLFFISISSHSANAAAGFGASINPLLNKIKIPFPFVYIGDLH